jgi:hypothetical protein
VDPAIAQATRRSGVVWVRPVMAERAFLVWHVWHERAAYLVTGGREQRVDGLADGVEAAVIVRDKASRARVLTWRAHAHLLAPYGDEWAAAVPRLQAKRLNAPDTGRQAERWALESQVWRLVPTGMVTERPGQMPTASGAAPPARSAATTVERPGSPLARWLRRAAR